MAEPPAAVEVERSPAAATRKLVGVAGLFDDPGSLAAAAEAVRDAGYNKWDCHTPYPVHGLDHAMGLKRSPVPVLCLMAGGAGLGAALLMQWWMSVVDYPVRVGGKPLFAWPAFVPITFELFVLFAALTAMGCVIVFCRLGRWHSPLHDSGIMAEITSRRYAVVLSHEDELFSEQAASDLLARAGCRDIRPLYELEEEDDSIL